MAEPPVNLCEGCSPGDDELESDLSGEVGAAQGLPALQSRPSPRQKWDAASASSGSWKCRLRPHPDLLNGNLHLTRSPGGQGTTAGLWAHSSPGSSLAASSCLQMPVALLPGHKGPLENVTERTSRPYGPLAQVIDLLGKTPEVLEEMKVLVAQSCLTR